MIFWQEAGDLPCGVWFRGFGNLSCVVVMDPAGSFDRVMHVLSSVFAKGRVKVGDKTR
jgi:hypothetical protein